MLKRIITITSLLFFITSFASSQNLVELSKKEKQRRQSVKGKKAKIVTNSDLGKVKRKMGLSATEAETSVDITSPRTSVSQASGTQDRAEAAQVTRTSSEDETSFKTQKAEFEQKWNKAQEYVDLLTTKINGLWQEFYSQDDMTYRGRVQAEISETHLRLQKARQDASLAKQELDKFLADARNRGVPEGWIR